MDTLVLVNLIGFFAAVISFVLWLPQAIRTWRVRKNPDALAAISPATQYLVLCNASLWGVYAALTSAFWTGAPGLINAPLAIATLFILHRKAAPLAEAIEHGEEDACICGFPNREAHGIYISALTGYGSVKPCDSTPTIGGVPVKLA